MEFEILRVLLAMAAVPAPLLFVRWLDRKPEPKPIALYPAPIPKPAIVVVQEMERKRAREIEATREAEQWQAGMAYYANAHEAWRAQQQEKLKRRMGR